MNSTKLSPVTETGCFDATSRETRRLHYPGCKSCSKPKPSGIRSACRPTRCYGTASRICSSDRSAGHRTMCAGITQTSATKPLAGRSPAAWSPRSKGIRATCISASASPSPICLDRPSASSPSTINEARRNSTSRKARTPSSGPGYRARSPATTRSGSTSTHSPAISATS